MDEGSPCDRDLAAVTLALRALLRTERTARTYPPGSQLSERALEQLEPVLRAALPLDIEVRRDQLAVEGREMLDAQSDRSGLPTRLHRDGVRRLCIDPGLDADELRRFVGALARPIHPDDLSEDYVTALWEANLPHVRVSAIDPYLDLDVPDEVLEGPVVPNAETEQAAAIDDEAAEQLASLPPPPEEAFRIRREDRQRIAREIEQAEASPPWSSFVAALFETLEKPRGEERIDQITRAVESSFHRLLVDAELDVAASLLERARGKLPPAVTPRMRAALDRMVHPERLDALQRTFESGRASAAQVERILRIFGSWATQSICVLLERASSEQVRQVYVDALVKIGPASLEPVLAHLSSAGPHARRDFVRALGRLNDPRASLAVATALRDPDPALRREVVRALARLGDASALASLVKVSLRDGDQGVRILALRSLGQRCAQIAPEQLLERTRSTEFAQLDEEEKDLLYAALGKIGGPAVLEFLSECLNAGWLLGRDDRARWRRAAGALVGMGTPEARRVLEQASRSWRRELARVCHSALRALDREQA